MAARCLARLARCPATLGASGAAPFSGVGPRPARRESMSARSSVRRLTICSAAAPMALVSPSSLRPSSSSPSLRGTASSCLRSSSTLGSGGLSPVARLAGDAGALAVLAPLGCASAWAFQPSRPRAMARHSNAWKKAACRRGLLGVCAVAARLGIWGVDGPAALRRGGWDGLGGSAPWRGVVGDGGNVIRPLSAAAGPCLTTICSLTPWAAVGGHMWPWHAV